MSPLPSVTFRSELPPVVRKELDQLDSELTGYLTQEHDEDGHHRDLHLKSLTVDGPVAITGGPVTIDGAPVEGSAPIAHHVSHETGGTDVITSIAGGVITSGTVNDARLSPNVALKNLDNNFSANQTISKGGPAVVLIDPAVAANARRVNLVNTGGLFYVQPVNDANSAESGHLAVNRAGDIGTTGVVFERSRGIAMGEWINIPFSAANFSVYPSGSWVVSSGQVLVNQYTLIGRTVIYRLVLGDSTVTGSPSHLVVTGSGAAGAAYTGATFRYGAVEIGAAYCNPGDPSVYLNRIGGAAWGATTGGLYLTLINAI